MALCPLTAHGSKSDPGASFMEPSWWETEHCKAGPSVLKPCRPFGERDTQDKDSEKQLPFVPFYPSAPFHSIAAPCAATAVAPILISAAVHSRMANFSLAELPWIYTRVRDNLAPCSTAPPSPSHRQRLRPLLEEQLLALLGGTRSITDLSAQPG